MMKQIALATSSEYPNLTKDEDPLIRELEIRGIEAKPVVWNSPGVQWHEFEAVIIRSCWDYHLKPCAFVDWLQTLVDSNIPVHNSVDLIRWNSDKRYLTELQREGIDIVPTLISGRDKPEVVKEKLYDLGWRHVVIKPVVSANAFQTLLIDIDDELEQTIKSTPFLRSGVDLLFQKFMPEIKTDGEWSFIFFDKKFSHAAIKQPTQGDFRVQEHLGGEVRPATPPKRLIEQAEKVIQKVEKPLLYGRVDGIESQGRFLLMELELIEPSLFLDLHELAPERFTEAIVKSVS